MVNHNIRLKYNLDQMQQKQITHLEDALTMIVNDKENILKGLEGIGFCYGHKNFIDRCDLLLSL